MSKKKKRRKRPGPPRPPTAYHTKVAASPTRQDPRTEERGEGAERHHPPKERHSQVRTRREAERRRRRNQFLVIAGLAVLAVVGLLVYNRVAESRAVADHELLAAGIGCDATENVGGLDRDHVDGRVEYESSPPAGGSHNARTLPARVFPEPLSDDPAAEVNTYRAVHSLEHGYIVIWHNDLNAEERRNLEREFRNPDEVIVVPYPEMAGDTVIAMTAWGKLQSCPALDLDVVNSFIELYRNKTGPESNVA